MMKIGDKLPEVLGLNEKGETLTLSQFSGKKLIVYAYPKDNTSGCTAEACSLKQHYAELHDAGYTVIGISKDSAASHHKGYSHLSDSRYLGTLSITPGLAFCF